MRILGADAASMSLVPEVIVASQRHLRVLGLSLIANPGTGFSQSKLSHEQVTRVGQQMVTKLTQFLREFIGRVNCEINVLA
jgi:purine-nucleoside phosphorylase